MAQKAEDSAEEKKPENKEEKENSDEAKEGEAELLSRGPVRAVRANVNYHPYAGSNPYPGSNESFDQACAAFGQHPPAMHSQYEYGQWNTNREILSSSSTPDTVSSDLGYSSSSTSPHQQQCTSSNYLMQNNCVSNTVLPSKVRLQ